MKKFTSRVLSTMRDRMGTFAFYRPFPGRHPVRLFIRLSIRREDPHTGVVRTRVRWSYDGHWNAGMLRTAERLQQKLIRECASSGGIQSVSTLVYEYCQTAILYQGGLDFGTYSSLHGMAFLNSPSRKNNARTNAGYITRDYRPVCVSGIRMLVPSDWLRDNKLQTLKAVVRTRRQWETNA